MQVGQNPARVVVLIEEEESHMHSNSNKNNLIFKLELSINYYATSSFFLFFLTLHHLKILPLTWI
jgi:hypothetical protein